MADRRLNKQTKNEKEQNPNNDLWNSKHSPLSPYRPNNAPKQQKHEGEHYGNNQLDDIDCVRVVDGKLVKVDLGQPSQPLPAIAPQTSRQSSATYNTSLNHLAPDWQSSLKVRGLAHGFPTSSVFPQTNPGYPVNTGIIGSSPLIPKQTPSALHLAGGGDDSFITPEDNDFNDTAKAVEPLDSWGFARVPLSSPLPPSSEAETSSNDSTEINLQQHTVPPIRQSFFIPGTLQRVFEKNTGANSRASRFATPAETRYNPTNHLTDDGDGSDGVSIPSDQADFGIPGIGSARGRNAKDAEGYSLADWDGKFAPAPVDWQTRPAFSKSWDRTVAWIENWNVATKAAGLGPIIDDVVEISNRKGFGSPAAWLEYQKQNDKTGQYQYSIDDAGACIKTRVCEIAPRSWFPPKIDGQETGTWWTAHLRHPDVVDEFPPWWMRYSTPIEDFILAIPAPLAHLEPLESEIAKVLHQTSSASMLTYDNKKLRHERAIEARKERNLRAIVNQPMAEQLNDFSPRVNIYLRPVLAKDVRQITEIYASWIASSVSCPEMDPISHTQVFERINAIKENKFPFIVAIDQSAKKNRKNRSGQQPQARHMDTERIMGFGFADDHHDIRGMYRYTAEIELFTHPDFVRRGIAGCILDKLLSVLDSTYLEKSGYEFEALDEDKTAFLAGGRRTIAIVLLTIAYNRDDHSVLGWKKDWIKKFGFEQCGNIEDIGRKKNMRVNVAIFRKESGTVVPKGAI